MTTLTRLDCGELHGDLGMFETGADGRVTLSVSAWLVRHPRGTVLFDTGMPASFVEGSARTRRISAFLTIGFGAGDRLDARLRADAQDPGRVDFVVVSHLHFDHVGGLSMVPNATVVVQRKEWEAGMAVAHDADTLHARKDYDLGHVLRLVDGEHDLFGDDAVVCIPTPGHTVGHQSLRVRLSTGRQVVLASDCCYFARTLDGGALPTFGHDFDEQRRSLAGLRKLRDDGAAIVPGHDRDFFGAMPRILGADTKT
jgi:glyoxylase-like metal-dependent hydrolase (beta-lactamase superfamily II)